MARRRVNNGFFQQTAILQFLVFSKRKTFGNRGFELARHSVWRRVSSHTIHEGRPGGDGDGVTPGQARRKFADLLRNFRSEPTAEYPDGRLTYRDKLDQDQPPRDVTVLLDDIIGA